MSDSRRDLNRQVLIQFICSSPEQAELLKEWIADIGGDQFIEWCLRKDRPTKVERAMWQPSDEIIGHGLGVKL